MEPIRVRLYQWPWGIMEGMDKDTSRLAFAMDALGNEGEKVIQMERDRKTCHELSKRNYFA